VFNLIIEQLPILGGFIFRVVCVFLSYSVPVKPDMYLLLHELYVVSG